MPEAYRVTPKYLSCKSSSDPADNCKIKFIRRIKNSLRVSRGIDGVRSGEVRYEIVVDGPDPCCCDELALMEEAFAWLPPVPADYPGEEADVAAAICKGVERLPIEGEYLPVGSTSSTAEFAVKRVEFKFNDKDCCRISATVTFDNKCLNNNSFYKIDGTRIDSLAELPEAAAKIDVQTHTEQKYVEFAEYHGIYNREGMKLFFYDDLPSEDSFYDNHNSGLGFGTFPVSTFTAVNKYCCRPLRAMVEGFNYTPINSAGIPFDPPLIKEETSIEYRITKPYLAANLCVTRALMHKVNCSDMWMVEYTKGVPTCCDKLLAGQARIADFDVKNSEWCDGTPIKLVTVTVRVKRNGRWKVENDPDTGVPVLTDRTEFGWDDLVANKGTGVALCLKDRDQHGGIFEPENAIDPVDGTINTSQFGASVVQQIQDSYDNLSHPQFLNHVGHVANRTNLPIAEEQIACSAGFDGDRLLYLRYRKYPRIDMLKTTPAAPNGEYIPAFVGTVFFPVDPIAPNDPANLPPGVAANPDVCICTVEEFDQCLPEESPSYVGETRPDALTT